MIKTVFLSLLLIMNMTSLVGMKKDHMRRDRVKLNAQRQAKAGERQVVHVQHKSESGAHDTSPTHKPGEDDSKSDSPVSPISSEDQEVSDELKKLDLDDDQAEDQENSGNDAVIFSVMNELMGAIAQADAHTVCAFETTTIPALDDKTILDLLVNDFKNNMEKFNEQQRLEVQRFFNSYKIKNCSFLWAAAESVFQTKQNQAPESDYQKSLEIVRILARVTADKSERHVLRTQDVVLSNFLCCVCSSKSIDIEGGLLHRAAQEDNADVMGILLKHGYDRDAQDTAGLTIKDYTLKFKRPKVKKFLE